MNSVILGNETVIRLGFFFGVFITMALWEVAAPRRQLSMSKSVRWFSNLGIVALNTIVLRLLVVTPDMHRVYHSVEDHEANSNFGFNLSVWDRLFGTYLAQPNKGHEEMEIGVRSFRDPKWNTLPRMLIQPFTLEVEGYVINRRSWREEQ